MKIGITAHVVSRFIQRERPDLTREAAAEFLRTAAAHAVKLPDRTLSGEEVWQVPGCEGRLVVKVTRRSRHHIAVTYLEPPRHRPSKLPEWLEAEIAEAIASGK